MASTNLFFIMIIFLQTLIISFNTATSTNSPSTILIFGDSTMDSGNNNYINTVVKSNFLPYGQDFPGHVPTGRFSNGKLVPDFIASALGIKETVPPFLDPNLSNDELLSGVNFASAGSGWDDVTTLLTKAIPVSKQIDMFKDYMRRVKGIVGDEEKVKKMISDSLVFISAATNDIVINFYDLPIRKSQFNISGYQDFLLDKQQSFVKELYELGCRRMIVAGLAPIGCLPIQMTAKFQNPSNRKCLEDQNSETVAYNQKLSNKIDQWQTSLPNSRIVYADIYTSALDMMQNPLKYGMVETKRGCCGSGVLEVAFLCNPSRPKCQNASQYLFWDAIHPSQSTYQVVAKVIEAETFSKLDFNQTLI